MRLIYLPNRNVIVGGQEMTIQAVAEAFRCLQGHVLTTQHQDGKWRVWCPTCRGAVFSVRLPRRVVSVLDVPIAKVRLWEHEE